MDCVLIALEGPQKGCSFSLTGEPCSIGRDACNTIQLVDPEVSRQHCTIRGQPGEAVLLADCDSRNGTFRNGSPVSECQLVDGDEIKVGASRFLFLAFNSEGQGAVTLGTEEVDPQTIVAIRPDQTVYLTVEKELPIREEADPLRRGIALLLRLSAGLQPTGGLEKLAQSLLSTLLDFVPAHQAAAALFEPDALEPSWVLMLPEPLNERRGLIPRHLIPRVMRDHVAALWDAGGPGTEPQRILVAPLLGSAGPIGLICLALKAPFFHFDRIQLDLAAAAGKLAGRTFEEALHFDRLKAENRRLQRELDLEHGIVGESPAMREVYRFLAKVSSSESTVLICGETGTGKELVARALHRNSHRASNPYVAINCAALSETLIESELFGHERGAFTGALAQKRGKLETADKGTIFLDEVGELSLPLQAKLLRVLQEREFERVGGIRPIRIDVRIIAATNRDLREAVAQGAFRRDLYYRLNVLMVNMPPLRERGEDVLLLAEHFLRKSSARAKRQIRGVSARARKILASYHWPGNVRQLENAIEHAVVIGAGDDIMPEDLPAEILDSVVELHSACSGFHEAVRGSKRRLILEAIGHTRGNYTEAARFLGLNPTYFHRLISNLDLRAEISRLLENPAQTKHDR